ncbi:M23 family metallopeptidase [Nonlabens ponticola]|uniref:M23 family metallopeptidase n=1 Tax=Nonlabens ponticola TaxID=2496866 RepID=A0A3S9MXT4_9FLAO|nr:M23 family metallopeptidase [Nonlabens ponticola]AZQ43948.1 M23 family metallopeptidase [Nonlabens ponticola]
MFRFLIILFLCLANYAAAQKLLVKSGATAIENGYEYKVTNLEPVPITVYLDFKLRNLHADVDYGKPFVVPAMTADYKLLTLKNIRQDSYGYDASASYVFGDQRMDRVDRDYLYHLPYKRSVAYRVSQGNNGRSTHRGKNAIDFSMPIGTPVHAARSGIVVQVKQDGSIGCARSKCLEYGNYIRILHEDCTIAEYTHLKVNGSVVQKGDHVEQDQHIGYSGNTGWTTGPHLHFTVYQPRKGKSPQSIPVKFVVGRNQVTSNLQENRYYRKP